MDQAMINAQVVWFVCGVLFTLLVVVTMVMITRRGTVPDSIRVRARVRIDLSDDKKEADGIYDLHDWEFSGCLYHVVEYIVPTSSRQKAIEMVERAHEDCEILSIEGWMFLGNCPWCGHPTVAVSGSICPDNCSECGIEIRVDDEGDLVAE